VTFEQPLAYFDKLVAFSTYYPIREDFYRGTNGAYGADADKLLYNGPFSITRWVHGASLKMQKNPHYWNPERAKVDVLDFAYITADANATLNLFKDGRIGYASLLAENLNEAMVQRWHIDRFMDGSVFYIEFNHRPGRLTGNHHLRKALQLANDSAELVYKVTKLPGYLPGESLFPIWLKGVNGFFREEYPAKQPTLDVKAARRHLELAKAELGVKEIPPLVLLSGDNPVSNIQAEYYQQVFRKHLGLELKIDKQIFKQRLAKMLSGEFDLVLAGWGPDYDDPLTFGDLFSSWNMNNRGRYRNPDLDRWVRVAQSSQDTKTRMDAFGEIQRIIIDDAVILPNYERGLTYVTRPELKGMVRRAVGPDPDFTNAFIEVQ
jgi:oligopeptide transport system substrate-binding protein